jgi:hypothetical protein
MTPTGGEMVGGRLSSVEVSESPQPAERRARKPASDANVEWRPDRILLVLLSVGEALAVSVPCLTDYIR